MGNKVEITFDQAAIKRVAEDAAKKAGKDLDRRLRRLGSLHKGKPVEDVKRTSPLTSASTAGASRNRS
ncbi:MAG TPA: hypothetical protein VJ819_10565 [Nocardioidaceae bacterium]|nr:hypothetical protein [Nocardioidaceae bacterium]